MSHHNLSPSKFPMWQQCAAFESKPFAGEAAERGTMQHKALELRLKNSKDYAASIKGLSDDEYTGVEWAANYIKQYLMVDTKLFTEQRLEFYNSDDDFEPLYYGTGDVVAVLGNSVDLFDYKSGGDHGYTPQMAGYAACLFQKYPQVEQITVHLLYGKDKRADSFTLTRSQAESIVRRIIARRNDPHKKPTPCDFCGWCKNAATCEALNDAALTVAGGREDWKLETYHASQITKPEEMAKALKLARFLSNWADAIEHHAKEMALKQGQKIPGFVVAKRAGAREIKDPQKAYEAAKLAWSDFLPCCSVSVTALEKKLGKDAMAALEPVITRKAEAVFLTKEKEMQSNG